MPHSPVLSISFCSRSENCHFLKLPPIFSTFFWLRLSRLIRHSFSDDDVTGSEECLVQLSEVRDGGVSTLVWIMWWPVPGVRYISLATRDVSPRPLIGQPGARLASDWLVVSPGGSYQWQSLHHKTITLLHILMVTKTQQMVRCHPSLTRLQTLQQKMQDKDI